MIKKPSTGQSVPVFEGAARPSTLRRLYGLLTIAALFVLLGFTPQVNSQERGVFEDDVRYEQIDGKPGEPLTLADLEAAGMNENAPHSVIATSVWYTAEALAETGSLEELQRIANEHVIARTNQGLRDSGINASFKLVHVGQVGFAEDTEDFFDNLTALKGEPSLHQVRDEKKTDAQFLLISSNTSQCGGAFGRTNLEPNPYGNTAGTTIHANCLNIYGPTHELGHAVFGMDHHIEQGVNPLAHFGHAFRNEGQSIQSVMSTVHISYLTKPFFSNPELVINGESFGDHEHADNTRLGNIARSVSELNNSEPSPVTTWWLDTPEAVIVNSSGTITLSGTHMFHGMKIEFSSDNGETWEEADVDGLSWTWEWMNKEENDSLWVSINGAWDDKKLVVGGHQTYLPAVMN